MLQYFFLYILIASIVSFALFGIDKRKAHKQKWRISERHLLLSVAFGGRIGGVVGMSYFRHKTIKSSFLRRFWCIVGTWIIITIVVMATVK